MRLNIGREETARLHTNLVETGWLSRCPTDFQDALLARAQWQSWQRDEILWLAGQEGGGLIGIAEGVAGVMTGLAEPGVPMGYFFRAGSWSGDNTVLTNTARKLTLIARTPVKAVFIPNPQVAQLLDATPKWWRWIGVLSSMNGMLATLLATDLMRPRARQRVASVLLHISGIRSSPDAGPVITTGISQSDLGALCGVTRTSVRIILKEFEDRGWVTFSYRHFCVQEPQALHGILSVDCA